MKGAEPDFIMLAHLIYFQVHHTKGVLALRLIGDGPKILNPTIALSRMFQQAFFPCPFAVFFALPLLAFFRKTSLCVTDFVIVASLALGHEVMLCQEQT